MRRLGILLLGLGAAGAGGCGGDDAIAPSGPAPLIVSLAASANPHNVLSSSIAFTAERADSARVVYQAEGLAAESTPFLPVSGGADTATVLALLPETSYRLVLEIAGPGGVVRSDTLTYRTPGLPELLRRVEVATSGAGGSGLTLTAVQVGGGDVFAVAFDSVGRIRWYRRFAGDEPVVSELKQQPNGRFTLFRGTSYGSQKVPGHYVEFTPAGDSVRAIAVAPPRYLDNHELLVTGGPGEERFHFFTYDHRSADLTPFDGPREVSLAGHQLVRTDDAGAIEFEWNAWHHIGLDEWIEPPWPDALEPGEPDYDHPNSLAFDLDGGYVASFRHLGQVLKIDARTREVVWRLGGARSDFSFVNDPFGGFSAQHFAHTLPDGHVLLFDNGTRHQPAESRAVEYALDQAAGTATLVWEFRHLPPIYTPFVGSVQRLRTGTTLVAFAQVGYAVEADPTGAVAWTAEVRVDGAPAWVYRLIRIASLYRYERP